MLKPAFISIDSMTQRWPLRIAVRVVVFAYDARHVLHAQHVPLRVAPDDLLGDLPLAGQRRRDGMGVSVSALPTDPPIGVSPCEASAAERTFSPMP